MSSTTPALHALNPTRLRSLVWPREHGAWGILLVPLLAGAWIGNPQGERIIWLLLFAAVALGLFCLRTPVEALLAISPLRPQNDVERRATLYSIYLYASVSGLSLAILLWKAKAYGLLLLGAAAAAAFLIQSVMKMLGRQSRVNAQLTGAVALTSTAAGAYYLASGSFSRVAFVLWAVNWLFAANQIQYVQLRIHSARVAMPAEKFARGKGFLLGEVLTLLLLAMAWRAGWLPGLALAAFGPVLFRGLAWFVRSPHPLAVRRMGVSELTHAIVFGVLIVASFQLQFGYAGS
jgi:hypothetical protein